MSINGPLLNAGYSGAPKSALDRSVDITERHERM